MATQVIGLLLKKIVVVWQEVSVAAPSVTKNIVFSYDFSMSLEIVYSSLLCQFPLKAEENDVRLYVVLLL